MRTFAAVDAGFDFHLLEHRIRVEAKDQFLDALARCFEGPGRQEAKSSVGIQLRVQVEVGIADGENGTSALATRVTTDPPRALEGLALPVLGPPTSLTRALTEWAVANSSQHYVFHAGAVSRGGKGILLPAASYCGKSTLVAGLIRHAFELLSDEVGAIDISSGLLVGYPRALSIRRDVFSILGFGDSVGMVPGDHRTRMVTPEELGASRAPGAAEIVLIVAPRFDASAETRLERLRPALATLALMEASCSQSRFKVAGLELIIDLAQRIPCYRLIYSDLSAAIAEIERAFADARSGAS